MKTLIHPKSRLEAERLAIFLFHGVIAQQRHRVRNYTRKHLEKHVFARMMKDLAAAGTPLSMDAVRWHCETGTAFPPRAFAITFDDGFANNLTVAAPILADLGLPATVYVTSGFVDGNLMSWIDRIEWALEETPAGRLRLPWRVEPFAFADDDAKISLLEDIRAHVKADPTIVVETLIADIFEQLGLPEKRSGDGPLDLKLTWEEVRRLAAEPGFAVGGHSHRHCILSFLDPAALEKEVATSLALLRDRAGVGPAHYSYPEGLAHCFSDTVIAVLKRHGVRICPTAIDGTDGPGTDPFHLHRIMIG